MDVEHRPSAFVPQVARILGTAGIHAAAEELIRRVVDIFGKCVTTDEPKPVAHPVVHVNRTSVIDALSGGLERGEHREESIDCQGLEQSIVQEVVEVSPSL